MKETLIKKYSDKLGEAITGISYHETQIEKLSGCFPWKAEKHNIEKAKLEAQRDLLLEMLPELVGLKL